MRRALKRGRRTVKLFYVVNPRPPARGDINFALPSGVFLAEYRAARGRRASLTTRSNSSIFTLSFITVI